MSAKKRPEIKLGKVKSSAIRAVGYDKATQTLRVEFTSGGVYDYADVDEDKHADLMAAKSIGKHWGEHIRAAHDSTKVS